MSKRKIIIILSVLVVFFYFMMLFSNATTTYKYGIKKSDYYAYFEQEYNDKYYDLNSAQKNYSTLTEFRLPDTELENYVVLEHMVRTVDNDLKMIEDLNSKNNFFTAIDIKGVKIKRIEIVNLYNDKKLESNGTYIYTESDLEGVSWNVKRLDETKLESQEGDFAYVVINKFPVLQSSDAFKYVVPQKYWFPQKMVQKIEVEYYDKDGKIVTKNYEFQLYWIRWWGIIENIITVT